jgi:hypothetical protein
MSLRRVNAAQQFPLRGIVIGDAKSIGVCELNQAGLIAIALSVLCQPRGINSGNGIIHRLVHTGVAFFLTPGGGALAQRFGREAHAENLCATHLGHIKVRIAQGIRHRPVCEMDRLLAVTSWAGAVSPIVVQQTRGLRYLVWYMCRGI